MNCANFEADVALFAGGDLAQERSARLEEHLAECSNCRELIEDLHAERRALVELQDDPLAERMAAQIHSRVMSELQGRAGFRRRGTLVKIFALAAALVLAIVHFWPRNGKQMQPIQPIQPAEAHTVRPPETVVPVQAWVAHHRRRRKPAAAKADTPLLVQFVTDDPDIVVYWLVDQKPQGD